MGITRSATRGVSSATTVTEPSADLPRAADPASLSALPALPALPPLPSIGPVARRVPPGGARREWQRARVVEVRPENARARTYRLALPDGQPHVPGQHYMVRVVAGDGSMAQRSYSVGSAPQSPAEVARDGGVHVELTIERIADGDLSPFLHDEVSEGDHLDVRGPFGGWFVWRGDTPVLLLGGGSGVVPLMSMVRHWRAKGGPVPLSLVQSVRSPADLLYAGEYGQETTLIYTREAPAGWPRAPGRLDAATLTPLLGSFRAADTEVFVCGSAGFAEHASQLAASLGIPAGSIRVERFGPG